MTFCFGAIKMNEEVNLALPKSSPYQCDLDFVLIEDSDRFRWEGTGDREGDHCGSENNRRIEDAAADAVFRLSIVDGEDVATAVITVYAVGLPTGLLGLEYIDHP